MTSEFNENFQDNKQPNYFIRKLIAYIKIARINQPIGYFLLLYPTLIPLIIVTNGLPPIRTFLIFIAGVFIMRSAGCIINDIADRDIDGKVERTKDRPLTNGSISITKAIIFFLILIAIALFLAIQLSPLTISLAVVSLIISVIYPFSKRFFKMPQLVLALSFSMPIPMIYAEVTGSFFQLEVFLLMIFNISWTIAYDTQYALSDKEYDLKLGINSTAILFGQYVNSIVSLLLILSWITFCLVGFYNMYGEYFFISIIVIPLFFVYQYFMIRKHDPQRCFQAFKLNNTIGIIYLFATCLGVISTSITN